MIITENQEIQHSELYQWQHKMEMLDFYEWWHSLKPPKEVVHILTCTFVSTKTWTVHTKECSFSSLHSSPIFPPTNLSRIQFGIPLPFPPCIPLLILKQSLTETKLRMLIQSWETSTKNESCPKPSNIHNNFLETLVYILYCEYIATFKSNQKVRYAFPFRSLCVVWIVTIM